MNTLFLYVRVKDTWNEKAERHWSTHWIRDKRSVSIEWFISCLSIVVTTSLETLFRTPSCLAKNQCDSEPVPYEDTVAIMVCFPRKLESGAGARERTQAGEGHDRLYQCNWAEYTPQCLHDGISPGLQFFYVIHIDLL